MLTRDVFFEKVVSYEAAQRRDAREKEDRQIEKSARKPSMEKWPSGKREFPFKQLKNAFDTFKSFWWLLKKIPFKIFRKLLKVATSNCKSKCSI